MKTPNRGFTLIELLVVISIIALLSSIILAALQGARSKGRDASKQEEIWQINNAIQLYMAANNGNAPTLGTYCNNNTTLNSATVASCIATSYDDYDDNGAWTTFMTELGSYISLPSASCNSSNCLNLGIVGYVYVSPAAMYYFCGNYYCAGATTGSATVDPTQYQIYTNLENVSQLGTKTAGMVFYDSATMYLEMGVKINDGQPVFDSRYEGTCAANVSSSPGDPPATGTGGCIAVRLMRLKGATYSPIWVGGCPKNPADGSIPPSCTVTNPSSVTTNSSGIYPAIFIVQIP